MDRESAKLDVILLLAAMVKKGGLEIKKHNQQTLYANAPLVVGMYELQLARLTPEFIEDFKAYTSEKRYGISFSPGKSERRPGVSAC